jgi:halimadienyl-diphosphate synthase
MEARIKHLLRSVDLTTRLGVLLEGSGELSSHSNTVAYDTAWVARLRHQFPQHGFDEALHWLRDHQHSDGSWGGEILHYHDRMVSTLSSLLALKTVGKGYDDEQRIRAGEAFLWHQNSRLNHDNHDTIGFPVLSLALVKEAERVGLDVPTYLFAGMDKLERKLNLLGPHPSQWLNTSLIFSFEALRVHVPFQIDFDFSETNGSVAASPAATVAALLTADTANQASLDYLMRCMDIQGDGGVMFVQPFDVFESAWMLNMLRQGGLITPNMPEVKRILEFLWGVWSRAAEGVSFSSFFRVADLDDTSVTFSVLKWAGYPVDASIFAQFEEPTHFRCYAGELDISLSANIRTLSALRLVPTFPKFEEWVDKIVAMLRRSELMGYSWFDKWHISPYYLTHTAIGSLQGMADDLLTHRVRWILKTQRKDGGWGYFHESTAEETAYCLMALLQWHQHVTPIEKEVLHAAVTFLLRHVNDTHYPEQWLAKSLYTPLSLVEATILSAIQRYSQCEDIV